MPTRSFYLDTEKTQEVIVTWRGIWKDVSVSLNGEVLGTFPNMRALKQGSRYTLKDGSPLEVYLSSDRDAPGLQIIYRGQPVQGTRATPQQQLSGIFTIACIIGGLNFIVGALGQFEVSEMLMKMGANWILMLIGALIIALGFVTWKKVSAVALTGIILILVIDIISTIYFSMDSGGNVPITGVGLKVLFIIQFSRGYKYITAARDQEFADRNLMNRTPQQ